MTKLAGRPIIVAASMLALAGIALVLMLVDLAAVWQKTVIFAIQMQRDLHRDLAAAMRAVEQGGTAALGSLIALGFLYGVFHAIGPGHGKVVISTYLATHESRLGRGLALSLLSSLMQGITAIAVVGATALLLQRSLRSSSDTGIALEVMSYGLVALIGVFLIWRSGRRLLRRSVAAKHDHDHHAGCCHAHGPNIGDLNARLSLRAMAVMVLSIGIRPCSGAVLVLILAFATDLIVAGMGAVMAMSLGTGLSVSALAALSVYARKSALALSRLLVDDGQVLASLFDAAALIGGLLILAFGVTLLNASLAVSKHPLL